MQKNHVFLHDNFGMVLIIMVLLLASRTVVNPIPDLTQILDKLSNVIKTPSKIILYWPIIFCFIHKLNIMGNIIILKQCIFL